MRWAAAGRAPVAHHGLQRSGTNYLLQCLLSLRVPVVNMAEPSGRLPWHKHFRWQHDKRSIPSFIRRQYGNELIVDDVAGLNVAAGYPPETRHLVIRKDETDWLVSILNWSLYCGWVESKEAGLCVMPALLADHRAYHQFWQRLADREPERVRILDLARVAGCPEDLCEALAALDIAFHDHGFTAIFEEVPKSPKGRARPVTAHDVAMALSSAAERP